MIRIARSKGDEEIYNEEYEEADDEKELAMMRQQHSKTISRVMS